MAAAFAVTFGCKKDPTVVSRAVTAYVPAACATPPSAFALYVASGDFDPSVQVSGGAPLDGLPQAAQAMSVDVTAEPQEWWGLHAVPPSGDVNVLLWPKDSPCALSTNVEPRIGAALGLLSDGRVLVVGGEPPLGPDPITPHSLVADMSTGEITALAKGILNQRSHPTVTAFAAGALVAGGTRTDGTTLDDAEVFVGTDFDRSPIPISQRAEHGAVVLVTGETLLVGGTDGNAPLASVELVDPKTRTSTSGGLAVLSHARTNPSVMRLASGEIMVAGGIGPDSMNMQGPVPYIEWLSRDATMHSRTDQMIPARQRSAFIALPAGGALGVLLPDPADTGPFQNVWVIGADGVPQAAAPLAITASSTAQPFLFGSAEGAPILWTGDRWLEWQPWTDTFVALMNAEGATGPTDEATTADPGLAMWLDHGVSTVHLTGLRFSKRGAFDTMPGSLLSGDTSFVAPDRLVAPGVIEFSSSTGASLAAGTSVFVTDTTYAGVTISVQAIGAPAPFVVLRDAAGDELEIGGSSCPFTSGLPNIQVVRTGAQVTVNGTTCSTGTIGTARVSIGLRGAPAAAPPLPVARSLSITRQ